MSCGKLLIIGTNSEIACPKAGPDHDTKALTQETYYGAIARTLHIGKIGH